jgi:hypothetical protein
MWIPLSFFRLILTQFDNSCPLIAMSVNDALVMHKDHAIFQTKPKSCGNIYKFTSITLCMRSSLVVDEI